MTGRVINPTFRNYHLPQFGDVPRTEVLFADTSDSAGPFGAKSMSESPYNPVAAAHRQRARRRDRNPILHDYRSSPIVSSARSWKNSVRLAATSGPRLAAARSRDLSAPLLRRGATRPHARQPSVRRHPGERGGRRADRDRKRLPAGSRHDRARGAAAGDASVQAIWQPDVLAGCTLYTSAEPCAMCAGAIYWAGIGRVVFGLSERRLKTMTGDHAENPTLDLPCRTVFAAGQRHVEVIGPLLEDEAAALHAGAWDAEQRSSTI